MHYFLMYHHALSMYSIIPHMCMIHPHHVCIYPVFILYLFELLVLFSPHRAADLYTEYCIFIICETYVTFIDSGCKLAA